MDISGPSVAGILGEEEYGGGRMHTCSVVTDALGRAEAPAQVFEKGWPCLALLSAASPRAETVAETGMSK